jgi:hypothetical protein
MQDVASPTYHKKDSSSANIPTLKFSSATDCVGIGYWGRNAGEQTEINTGCCGLWQRRSVNATAATENRSINLPKIIKF